uniref:Zinc finger protein 648 n=1 Tax=Sinocyclocheilus anshuiensis TaxID=1608454 RepID=A0A671SHF6_9TELE
MKMSFNLPSEEDISASASCDENKNKKITIQENSRTTSITNMKESVGDECEVEGNLNSSQNQVLKSPFVFAAMKKRGMEGDMENRPYKCPYCSWAFKKSSNLLSHIDTHQGLKPHVCDLCGKAYSHQGTLQQHKRLHTGERPYHCPFCEKSYIWSSDFRKHIRTHTGEKPYNCEECGKDFVRSSDLRKHERNIHVAEIGLVVHVIW